jgi:hypothetical protein
MQTILEVSPDTKTTYQMNDFTYTIFVGIYENYKHLNGKYPTMAKALSILPESLRAAIVVTTVPASQPLRGSILHVVE